MVYLILLLDWQLPSVYEYSRAIYWALDIAKFVVVPAIMIFVITHSGVDHSAFGIAPAKDARGLLAATALCVVLLPLVWFLPKPLPWAYLWPAIHLDFHVGKTIPEAGLIYYLGLIYLAITPAITEELFFRGVLHSLVSKWTANAAVYVVTSAALFASIHWELGSTVVENAFIYGLVAAWLFLRFRSVWPLVAGHFVTNVLAFSK